MGLTLDDALQAVAERSFYEDATVTPSGDGAYTVSDDYGTAYSGDDLGWTYAGGLDLEWGNAGHAREWTRVFEPFEYWDDAGHVRYNLPGAVEALERGRAVTFAYAVVANSDLAWDDDSQEYADADGTTYDDNAVGWIVLAFWED